jgi:hypothetical protein
MTAWLRQNSTTTLKVGPFVSGADNVTVATGLAGALVVKLSKQGGTLAARNDAVAITHDADGIYTVELNGTDTGTLGRLTLAVTPGSPNKPVRQDYVVVAANVYDSMIAASTNLLVNQVSSYTNTMAAVTGTSFTAGTEVPAIADAVIGYAVLVKSGTGAGQTRMVTAYTAGRVATVSPGWSIVPDTSSVYELRPLGLVAMDTTAVQQAIWNASSSSYNTVGTLGAALNTAGSGASASAIASAVWGATTRTITGGVITTNSDKTGYSLTGSITTLDGLRNLSVSDIWDAAGSAENGITLRGAMKIMLAEAAGYLTNAAGPTVTIRNPDNTVTRITATVDTAGNRSGISVNGS